MNKVYLTGSNADWSNVHDLITNAYVTTFESSFFFFEVIDSGKYLLDPSSVPGSSDKNMHLCKSL